MSRRASGLKAWVIQRITAIYIGLFSLVLLGHFVFNPPADHAAWQAWVASPAVALGLLVYVVTLIAHAWVGVRDVLIDYVKPIGLRVGLLSLFALTFLASALWAIQAIYLARLGG